MDCHGEDSVAITGTIYPEYFGGFGSLAVLRAVMPAPQMVVSGAGDVFGLWCIMEVGNEQSYQDAAGRPSKVTFDVKLERYGEDTPGLLGGFLGLGAGIGGIGGSLGGSIGLGGGSVGVDIGVGGLGVGVGVRLF